ncbi:unnamed protein product [Macrosiphum euphorbiae]|uniref:Uncharacterized protein n=1 Tax=Macrosiphum euphorbiae TaxID=13131 RepID=A0AAV0VN98_9HEMI|nr:unnamed protein product [Macrosiphum euphorbiae]
MAGPKYGCGGGGGKPKRGAAMLSVLKVGGCHVMYVAGGPRGLPEASAAGETRFPRNPLAWTSAFRWIWLGLNVVCLQHMNKTLGPPTSSPENAVATSFSFPPPALPVRNVGPVVYMTWQLPTFSPESVAATRFGFPPPPPELYVGPTMYVPWQPQLPSLEIIGPRASDFHPHRSITWARPGLT